MGTLAIVPWGRVGNLGAGDMQRISWISDLRSGMLKCFPGYEEPHKGEPPSFQSREVLISLVFWEWTAHEADISVIKEPLA